MPRSGRRATTTRWMTLWAKDGEVGCVHPGWVPIKGRKAVMTSWRNILGNPESPDVTPRKTRWSCCTGASGGRDVSGKVIGERGGQRSQVLSATNVFVKENGAWKIAHHHAGIANVDVERAQRRRTPGHELAPGVS